MLPPRSDQYLSYVQHFLHSPSTVATFLLLLALSGLLALVCPRRRLQLLAAGVSASAVVALTVVPAGGWTTFAVTADPVAAVRSALSLRPDDLLVWRAADGPANVALFVPLAWTLGLLLRRPAVAAVLGVVTSVAVESFQAATGTRVGSAADVVANGAGSVVGAAAAAATLLVCRLLPAARVGFEPTERSPARALSRRLH